MIRRATLTLALLALLVAAPAEPVGAAEPSLAISISNGVDEARPGDTLGYTATISNHGGEVFEGLVTIIAPAYLTFSDGTAHGVAATWDVTVPAGESRDIRTTATVGEGIGNDYQVVVTAAAASADAPLEVLVRSADADRIPGAHVPPPVSGMSDMSGTQPRPPDMLPLLIAGAIIALAAVGGLLAWFRLRRTHAGSPAHGRRARRVPAAGQLPGRSSG